MQASSETFAEAGAQELAAAVRARSVGALELTEAAIARIEALDGAINAVVVRDFERARDQAKRVDEAVARGAELPLAGVPMTVKEVFNVAGLPTTFGMEAARDYRPDEDAVAVARLKAAGAVILGKTNVPSGLSDYQAFNPIYGRTSNPHDLGRSPGGSSGGSAAALAAGMVPLELGGDAGGSIRVPAAFCGVYGHRSSVGLIPLQGHGPPGGGVVADTGWAVAGPMARKANDLALALGVLAGPHGREAKGWRLSLPAPRHGRLSDYRVFVLTEHPTAALDSEVAGAIDALSARLERAGAAVARRSERLPSLTDTQGLVETFTRIARASMGLAGGTPDEATPKDLHEAVKAKELLRRAWDGFFEAFDVVVAPCYATPAFPHFAEPDPWPGLNRSLLIDGAEVDYAPQHAWPLIACPPHLPATAAPIGRTRGGLPIGVQIIGPYLEDLTTIAFAERLSAEFGLEAEVARA
jgi:amidase